MSKLLHSRMGMLAQIAAILDLELMPPVDSIDSAVVAPSITRTVRRSDEKAAVKADRISRKRARRQSRKAKQTP